MRSKSPNKDEEEWCVESRQLLRLFFSSGLLGLLADLCLVVRVPFVAKLHVGDYDECGIAWTLLHMELYCYSLG